MNTMKQYEKARANSGWWAHARRSPSYRGWSDPPFESDRALQEKGWEPNFSAAYRQDYEYCNATGCYTKGGPNSSAKTWVKVMRRRVEK